MDRDEVILGAASGPIADIEYFHTMMQMEQAVKSGIADMVLMGIEPTYPSEKYGYIVPEAHPVIDGRLIAWPVDRFRKSLPG